MKKYYAFLYLLALVALDQIIKILVVEYIPMYDQTQIIGDLLVLTHVRNYGAAWSLFSDHTWILTIFTIVLLSVLAVVLLKGIIKNRVLFWGFVTVFAGGVGNLIDRIFRGNVVDYLYIKVIDFPVFNLADMLLTCTIVILMVYVLFTKEEKLISRS